jgi:DNA-binding beta-propeller fold protein YncE
MRFTLLAAILALLGMTSIHAQDAAGYKILQKISVPGEGGFDFMTVDEAARRLYITHANSVQVLDADSLKLIGAVDNVPKPHGIAIVPELNKGFASSGDPGSVVVFDLKTFKHLSEIPNQKDTDVIFYNAKSKMVLTFNGDSKNATVIDPVAEKVMKTIDLGSSPEIAVADEKGNVFGNLPGKNEVVKIKKGSYAIASHWPTAPGQEPTGMAIDVKNHLLFVGCHNNLLVVMDSRSGKVITSLPMGARVDTTVFDAKSGTVFNSCGDGTLSVIHEDSPSAFHVVENAVTLPGAKTMAFDSKTGHVFLDTAQFLQVTPTQADPKPRRKAVPGTFEVLVVGK